MAEGLLLIWLLADQGVFALTNFITNVLFARWLLPRDYGMFAVSFSGYLLLTVWHFGAILEPLLVQSARVSPTRQRSFIRVLIVAHLILIGVISGLAIMAFGIVFPFGQSETGWAILGAGIGGSLMCSLLSARRLCLVFLSTKVSALVGLLYMVGVVGTTYLLHHYGNVSWFDLWLIMGGWSLLCSIIIFGLLYRALFGTEAFTLSELFQFQWHYARFGMIAATCSWFRVDGVMLMLAHYAGLEVIAQTRAVLNVANPVIQINLALYTTWLVDFSRDSSWKQLRNKAMLYAIAAFVVCLVAFAIATPLVRIVYNGRYLAGAWLLPIYCIAIMFNGIESIFTCFLKALRAMWTGYAPQVTGSVFSIILGFMLVPTLNDGGAIYTVAISFVIGASLAFYLVRLRAQSVASLPGW
jgi:O-antigen/teichoic acid export membrane protein